MGGANQWKVETTRPDIYGFEKKFVDLVGFGSPAQLTGSDCREKTTDLRVASASSVANSNTPNKDLCKHVLSTACTLPNNEPCIL